ncbi:MAG: glycerophosphodiester phosphodiesterase [Patescibacteria group bacterium]|nr:glycerophosphodiester phosphodiesterase [Patescibacteria group bacterium]
MKIVGHRGARGLAPENTIASLQKALEHGVDIIEFDLQVTRDDVVVLDHDGIITDQSGSSLIIRDSTYAELKAHKPDLATLAEVFNQIAPSSTLYIEVKPGVVTAPIIQVINDNLGSKWQASHLLLASKGRSTLLELHKALPQIDTVVIEAWSGIIATHRARQVGTKYIAMNQKFLWRPFIQPMSRRGWKLMAYTLNDAAKAKKWQKYGLYAAITDYPDRFK